MKQHNIIALGLSLALIAGLTAPAVAADGDLFPATEAMPAFTDVVESGSLGAVWYDYGSVKVCVEAGLMKGTGAGFNPGGTLSVAEVATVAARIHEKLSGNPMPEQGDPWYQGAIQVMEELGLLMPDDPTVPASRADFVELLSAVLSSGMLEPINSITTLPDTDDSDVLAFYNAGIITGSDKYGSFTGDRGLSRAEAAAMLARIVRPSLRKTFTLEQKSGDGPVDDIIMELMGVSSDTTIFTVDGRPVRAGSFFYFLYDEIYDKASDYGYEVFRLMDIGAGLKSTAQTSAAVYCMVESMAAAEGITLSQEDQDKVEQSIADGRAKYGGAEGFQAQLQKQAMNESEYRLILSSMYLYDQFQAHLFGDLSREELAAYVEEQGILKAKHILVSDKALAEDLLARLKAAGNSEAEFDALAEQYSKDGRNADGSLAAPGGYTFLPNEMVEPFEEGTKALKPGEVSGLVESDYGYHIILRLEVAPDDVLSLKNTSIQDAWAADKMDALLRSKWEAAVIETTAFYDSLDPYVFADKIVEFQENH